MNRSFSYMLSNIPLLWSLSGPQSVPLQSALPAIDPNMWIRFSKPGIWTWYPNTQYVPAKQPSFSNFFASDKEQAASKIAVSGLGLQHFQTAKN